MKKKHLTLLILSFSTLLFSQADIQWGAPYESIGAYGGGVNILGAKDGLYHIVTKGKSDERLLTYNLKNEVVNDKPISLSYQDEPLIVRQSITTKTGLWVVSNSWDVKDRYLHILATPLVDSAFADTKLVFSHLYHKGRTMNAGGRFDYETPLVTHNNDSGTNLFLSEDKSKVVYCNTTPVKESKKMETLTFCVMDENMNRLWDNTIELPFERNEFWTTDVAVANDGTAYLCGWVDTKEGSFYYPFKVFRVHKGGFEEIGSNLMDKESVPNSTAMIIDEKKGVLILTGLYRGPRKSNHLLGSFYAEIDLTSDKKTVKKISPFTEKMKKEMEKPSSPLLYEVRCADQLDNGNVQFLAEYYFLYSTRDGFRTYTHHELIYTCFDKSGNLLHSYIFPRKFITDLGRRKGSAYFVDNGQTFLLFDTSATREEKKKQGIEMANFHTITKLVSIDDEGKLVYEKMLCDSKNMKGAFNEIVATLHQGYLILGGKFYNIIFQGPGILHGDKKDYQFGSLKISE